MRKITIVIVVLAVLLGLILVIASCPRSYDIEPGQGDVKSRPSPGEFQERELEVPENLPSTPGEAAKQAAEGTGEEEAAAPEGEGGEGEEAAPPEEGGDEEAAPDDGEGEAGDEGEAGEGTT